MSDINLLKYIFLLDNQVKHIEEKVLAILEQAGAMLLELFKQDIIVTIKSDKSQVTNADLVVNDFIVKELQNISDVPIISEEQDLLINRKYMSANEFWMLDPLDGTSAFIKKTKEFAISLAYIKNNKACFGYIHIPFAKISYYSNYQGAFTWQNNVKKIIKTNKKSKNMHLIASKRMQLNNSFKEFQDNFSIEKTSFFSSALKFCKIAAGEAQIFPYFSHTMEWDSAAGDAIIHAAGGSVLDLSGKRLLYGLNEDFINPYFIAKA
jgi:3'(2'), 5'-bisphosphate nucleotidase